MIKAVILDCFGVLVGTGFDDTYSLAGGDPIKDKQFIHDILLRANYGQISREEFGKELTDKLGITIEDWRKAAQISEKPNEELLKYALSLKPKYKVGILSNVNSGVIEHKIDKKYLDQFDAVVVSADAGVVKPWPEAYEYAANKLGAKLEECIFTDDNVGFIEAAKQIGMKAFLYQNTKQCIEQIEKLIQSE